MKKSTTFALTICLLAAAMCAAAPALAAQPAAKPKAPPAMNEQAAMETYMKAAAPGPVHEEMGKMSGKWKLDVTFWFSPGAPPQKSSADAEFKMVMGGRYLQQDVHGEMGGQPFEGLGIEGYDNVTKERFGTWFDNMSTGEMTTRGQCAAGAKTCTLKGMVSDAMAGKKVPIREVVTKIDDGHMKFETYGLDASGKEFKTMEIMYTRQ